MEYDLAAVADAVAEALAERLGPQQQAEWPTDRTGHIRSDRTLSRLSRSPASGARARFTKRALSRSTMAGSGKRRSRPPSSRPDASRGMAAADRRDFRGSRLSGNRRSASFRISGHPGRRAIASRFPSACRCRTISAPTTRRPRSARDEVELKGATFRARHDAPQRAPDSGDDEWMLAAARANGGPKVRRATGGETGSTRANPDHRASGGRRGTMDRARGRRVVPAARSVVPSWGSAADTCNMSLTTTNCRILSNVAPFENLGSVSFRTSLRRRRPRRHGSSLWLGLEGTNSVPGPKIPPGRCSCRGPIPRLAAAAGAAGRDPRLCRRSAGTLSLDRIAQLEGRESPGSSAGATPAPNCRAAPAGISAPTLSPLHSRKSSCICDLREGRKPDPNKTC